MGVPDAAIQRAERALGVAFPADYRGFLTDPGSVARHFLPAGDFLTLCPVGDLLGLNDAAGPVGRLPGAVVIGGDGSRELLVYDFRQQPPRSSWSTPWPPPGPKGCARRPRSRSS